MACHIATRWKGEKSEGAEERMITPQQVQRNRDITLHTFADVFFVRCPRCQLCAKVIPNHGVLDYQPSPYYAKDVRFSCVHCGLNRDWQRGCMRIGGPLDWYFGFPLYLQISCCGKILWALNLAHLRYLEAYVQATLREGQPTYNTSI